MRIHKRAIILLFSAVAFLPYQNCSNTSFSPTPETAAANALNQNSSGTLVVGASGSNPQLDLFFIVDNSASMYKNQLTLAQSFSSIFLNNSDAVSNFNVNVYLFSTASTVIPGMASNAPQVSPASLKSVPQYSDINGLIKTPGNVFAYWNNASGTYGTAPFSEQFNPAPVIASTPTSKLLPQALFIAQKGSQTAAQYKASINQLSADFQARLAYLNPSNQFQPGNADPVSSVTDISSGLCSMSRILNHSADFIPKGDAAAFIIVSDDNDRINAIGRNPAGNGCIESVKASDELINGSCGHYQANYNYEATSTLTYQNTTSFTYPSGSNIAYSYPSSESCKIQYRNGYKYSWTYTSLNTKISYTQCTVLADGFCVETAANTVSVPGNYVGPGGSCLAGASNLVPSPAPGSGFSCAANNTDNVAGTGGVDANSDGSQCSSQLLSSLMSNSIQNIKCSISVANNVSTTIANQVVDSCANYCASSAGSSYPACTLLSKTSNLTKSTLALGGTLGLTCASQCPSSLSAKCGSGTIASYITTKHPTATCGSNSNASSTITVMSGVDSAGAQLTCDSSVSALKIQNSGGSVVCGKASTVRDCIDSLQSGASASCALASSQSKLTLNTVSATDVKCDSPCSSSGGLCTGSGKVAAYIAQSKAGYCIRSDESGKVSFSLVFKPSVGNSASCTSLCSDAVGGCDGKGYGTKDSSTVASYIQSLGGNNTCSSVVTFVPSANVVAENSNPIASCADPNNSFFVASGSAYAGSATVFTNGASSDHQTAADFQSYIVNQSKSLFGANLPAVAILGHMNGDTGLASTDVSSDYIKLASLMGSNQTFSVAATDYSPALTQISSFITMKAQNTFALSMPSGSVVTTVSVQKLGSQTWTSMPKGTTWTQSGETLNVNPTAGLNPGDQLTYNYSSN